MAFQANAFQSNAFQICAGNNTGQIDIALERRKKRREAELARERYELACKALEEVESVTEIKEYHDQLEAVILPFKKGDDLDIAELMRRGQAKRKFEQILLSIRQLEEDILEVLALLLLANEAL